jgi:hypothetical protein
VPLRIGNLYIWIVISQFYGFVSGNWKKLQQFRIREGAKKATFRICNTTFTKTITNASSFVSHIRSYKYKVCWITNTGTVLLQVRVIMQC